MLNACRPAKEVVGLTDFVGVGVSEIDDSTSCVIDHPDLGRILLDGHRSRRGLHGTRNASGSAYCRLTGTDGDVFFQYTMFQHLAGHPAATEQVRVWVDRAREREGRQGHDLQTRQSRRRARTNPSGPCRAKCSESRACPPVGRAAQRLVLAEADPGVDVGAKEEIYP